MNDTATDGRCPCGYVIQIPRFAFIFDVWDNKVKADIASDGFGCDDIRVVIGALREAADRLEKSQL